MRPAIDLIGKEFGFLKVISREISKVREPTWKCLCKCGNEKLVVSSHLKRGAVKSCGCYKKNEKNRTPMIGENFNLLTIIKQVKSPENSKEKRKYFLCKCYCGNEAIISSRDITYGRKKSCGCLRSKQKGVSAYNGIKSTYLIRAKKHKREFDLNDEDFRNLITSNCHYCGINGSAERKSLNNGSFIYNTIDRIDSKKGYINGNCVSCCKKCNKMKLDLNYSDFINQIKNIYQLLELDYRN